MHLGDNTTGPRGGPPNGLRTLAAVIVPLLLARILFLWFKPYGAVALDILYWDEVSARLTAGQNPYVVTTRLNWPPFWMQILNLLSKLSASSGIPLRNLVQALLAGAECCVAAVLLLRFRVRPATLIAGFALNPICVLLTCQHGNFDVLVGLWVLLFTASSLSFARSRAPEDWLLACAFLGLGVLTKTVPIVLLPLLSRGAKGLSPKVLALGGLLLFTPVALGMSVILTLGEEAVVRNVIQYRSVATDFGIVGVITALAGGGERLPLLYGNLFFLALLGGLIAAARLVQERRELSDRHFVLLTAVLLASIPALGPGYGTQYAYWFLPLLVLLYQWGDRPARRLIIGFYCVAALTYAANYLFLPSHGALAARLLGPSRADPFGALSAGGWRVTLLNGPLFFMYLAFLRAAVRDLAAPGGRPGGG